MRVDVATTLRESIDLARDNTYDVAFIDLNLGDGWGLDLVDTLYQLPSCCAGSIVMTGLPRCMHLPVAFGAGAADFLSKPISASEVPSAALCGLERTHVYRARLRLESRADAHEPACDTLTNRIDRACRAYLLDDVQRTIVHAIVQEEPDKVIADKVGFSVPKVKRVEEFIRRRMGVSTRVGVARAVLTYGGSGTFD